MRRGAGPGAGSDLVVGARALGSVRLDVLHAFLVVAEELHFTRSAARLFISQSGLSRIALLERTIGQPLLCRAGREVRLTHAGETMVPHVEAIILSALAASEALTALPRRRSSLGVATEVRRV